MMAEHQLIRTDLVADGILEIALSRPERRNALTMDMLDELSDTVDRAIGEFDARVMLLTGDGPSFCPGADLRSLQNPDSRAPGPEPHVVTRGIPLRSVRRERR